MKLVVPLTIPWMRSIGVAESDSSSTRTTGTAPATAASKRRRTPRSRAVPNSSSPYWDSSCLFALTTSLPARIADSRWLRAGSMPPISSTITSASARISSKSPRVRVSTPLITGRRPLKRSISSALSASSSAKAPPTVPDPSRPTRYGAGAAASSPPRALVDIARGQVLEALAPYDDACVAVAAEDHRRAGDAVVVVRHRIAVGAGRGRDDHVARARVLQERMVRDHVARLAVLAGEHVLAAGAEAVGDIGLIRRRVEHRSQVVGHAAVDRHPAREAGLYRLDRVERHARVRAQRASGLDQQPRPVPDAVLLRGAHDRRDPLVDRRRLGLEIGVAHAEPAPEVPHREGAQPCELRDLPPEGLELEQLRADVGVDAEQLQVLDLPDALDRRGGLLEREAELRVVVAGRDLLVRVAAHVRVDADEHSLSSRAGGALAALGAGFAAPLVQEPSETLDLVEVVDHDRAEATGERRPELLQRLRVAVHHDPLRREAGGEGEMELAGGGHVAPQPLSREHGQHGCAGKRLRGEHDL